MARDLVAASSMDISSTSNTGISGSTNRTFLIWSKPDALSGAISILYTGVVTTDLKWRIRYNNTNPRVEIEGSGYDSALVASTSAWQVVGCVLDGTTLADNTLYLNASSEDASGTATLNTTDTTFKIGTHENPNENFYDGKFAYAYFWNTNLSANEIAVISRGIHPFIIQHDNLVIGYDLNGNESPEGDYSTNQNKGILTNTPTKFAGNPPVELLENYL